MTRNESRIREAFASGDVVEFRFAGFIHSDVVRRVCRETFQISAIGGPGNASYRYDQVRAVRIVTQEGTTTP